MLIDTHAHLNFNAFKDDAQEVIKRSLKKEVWMINVGSQIDTSKRAVEYADQYEKRIFAAVGLHPIHLKETEVDIEEVAFPFKSRKEEFDEELYREWANHPKVVAIGECGLDYHRYEDLKLNEEDKEKQKEVFLKQIALAQSINKPLIVHCRGAHPELIKILREVKWSPPFRGGTPLPLYKRGMSLTKVRTPVPLSGVIHCFSGNWDQAQEYFDLGFLISFTGLITFNKEWDKLIKKAPLEKLLIETDCPYLTPVPFRGRRNEPRYVEYVARKIAELKGLSFEEVADETTKNAIELFGLT